MSLLLRAACSVLLASVPQPPFSADPGTRIDLPFEAAKPPLIPPATIDDSLDIVGEKLSAREMSSRLSIEVKVNGRGPYHFLVDSGADRSVIGTGLAEQLDLATGATVTLNSIAGKSSIGTVELDDLQIGNSMVHGIHAPALPEQYLGSQGIIGIDALSEQRLMLDFDKKTITLQDPHRVTAAAVDGEEIVVMARRRHGQLILTEVSIPEGRVYAIIDTGAQLSMGNSALLARIFRGRKPPVQRPITVISVTGQSITASLVILPKLKIGRMTLLNLPVAFADVPPFALFGVADQPSLLLGTDALQTFSRVSLDFRQRKVRFQMRDGA